MNSLASVKSYSTRIDAEVDRGYLESQNIQAFVTADDEGGMAPFLIQSTKYGVQLMVSKRNFNKAKNLLKAKL
ncbi:hypothetical protein HY086_04250 [Candidatus Gottesmanbacteria bacterium]|nr:hypothetical protein [Candidatus Gottesmanbacteria bacterium]